MSNPINGTSAQHPAVRAYLQELDRSLAGVPSGEREAIVAETAEHIALALQEQEENGGKADVTSILSALGEPALIAAEATDTASNASAAVASPPAVPTSEAWQSVPFLDRRAGYVLIAVLLVAGMTVLPTVGYIAALVLIWASKGWKTWQKLVGTLAPLVAGVLTVLTLYIFAVSNSDNPGAINPLMLGGMSGWRGLVVVVIFAVAAATFFLATFRAVQPVGSATHDPSAGSRNNTAPATFLDRQGGSYLTVALLTVGGIVLPLAGWVAGVVLLLVSRGWRRWEKVIGAVVVPSATLVTFIAVRLLGMLAPQQAGRGWADECTVDGYCSRTPIVSSMLVNWQLVLPASVLLATALGVAVFLLVRFRPASVEVSSAR